MFFFFLIYFINTITWTLDQSATYYIAGYIYHIIKYYKI